MKRTYAVNTVVSKLPVRQLTAAETKGNRRNVSKLPVRQLTYNPNAFSNTCFSKLPVRQLTHIAAHPRG